MCVSTHSKIALLIYPLKQIFLVCLALIIKRFIWLIYQVKSENKVLVVRKCVICTIWSLQNLNVNFFNGIHQTYVNSKKDFSFGLNIFFRIKFLY